MAWASPITSRFFLVKWAFITGQKVKNFTVDKLWSFGGDFEDIRLNDNLDSYLRDEEAEVFGKLVVHRINIWIKVISDPIEKEGEYFQSCFLCIKGRNDEEIVKIRELLNQHGRYTWQEKTLFPWLQGAYIEPEIKTYQDK